jgi:hypothetical protein
MTVFSNQKPKISGQRSHFTWKVRLSVLSLSGSDDWAEPNGGDIFIPDEKHLF